MDPALHTLPAAFTHAEAARAGLSDRRLRALVTGGALQRIGHGVYRRADAPPADLDRVELALRAPEATLCLGTAAAIQDLTDRIPAEIDVALPRSRRPPRVGAPARWHRFDEQTFALGRTPLAIDEGMSMGLYSPERTIIDLFRLRHHEGEDLALGALRRWARRPGATPSALLAMARHFPVVEPALLAALRVLG
ncbi:MAG: type IV toxin-antitoxin system AbiEi family antitoxin domain-containing protein [Deltaproteobacteria bacterium]|nr:type IV toxin-antitoxin system AbiEi family antitoxin domain-containing protein [Deltaproteobacteria bacterium]